MKLVLSTFLVFCLTATLVQAGPIIRMSDGTTTIEIADNGVGDTSLTLGVINTQQSVGSWFLVFSTGLTKPIIGDASHPNIDLNSVTISSTGPTPAPLTISFTDTGFVGNPLLSGFASAIGGTTDGTMSMKAYYDDTNAAFGLGTLIADTGPMTGDPSMAGLFGGMETYSGYPTSEPFSLTVEVTVQHDGTAIGFGQSSSFDAEIVATPEPTTFGLIAAGSLLGACVLRRRRRKTA